MSPRIDVSIRPDGTTPARPNRSQPDSYCRATAPSGSGAARSDEPAIVPTIALSR
jgi:hypothetical protein